MPIRQSTEAPESASDAQPFVISIGEDGREEIAELGRYRSALGALTALSPFLEQHLAAGASFCATSCADSLRLVGKCADGRTLTMEVRPQA